MYILTMVVKCDGAAPGHPWSRQGLEKCIGSLADVSSRGQLCKKELCGAEQSSVYRKEGSEVEQRRRGRRLKV